MVSADHRYYGFTIAAPKHEWPLYASGQGWHRTPVMTASDLVTAAVIDFAAGPVEADVAGSIDVAVDPDATVNAVRLAGRIELCAGHTLGPSHSVNGDRILAIRQLSGTSRATLRWSYQMGAGLGALQLGCAATATRSLRGVRLRPHC